MKSLIQLAFLLATTTGHAAGYTKLQCENYALQIEESNFGGLVLEVRSEPILKFWSKHADIRGLLQKDGRLEVGIGAVSEDVQSASTLRYLGVHKSLTFEVHLNPDASAKVSLFEYAYDRAARRELANWVFVRCEK